MGSYKLSNGERIDQKTLDKKITKAKSLKIENMINEYGYMFCEDCHRSQDVRIDCSHEKSVDQCKKQGCTELCYDINNIKMRCRDCHQKHDGLYLIFGGK